MIVSDSNSMKCLMLVSVVRIVKIVCQDSRDSMTASERKRASVYDRERCGRFYACPGRVAKCCIRVISIDIVS